MQFSNFPRLLFAGYNIVNEKQPQKDKFQPNLLKRKFGIIKVNFNN